MPDTYLPWFAGYWCAPFNWFSDGKLRRAGIHGFAAYHAIRHICDDRGLKPPCDIDEAHVEPAALVRATGGGIGAVTRAYGLLLESGILSRTVTGQIRVLESTPKSPEAKRQEARRNRAESQESGGDSHATVTRQSRTSHGRSESESEIRDPRAKNIEHPPPPPASGGLPLTRPPRKPRRPAGDWTPPPPREDPDFETAVRIHQKTLAGLKQDVPPRAAYGNPPDEPRKARGLSVEVLIIQDLLPAYPEERLSRVVEGALLDDWTTERRAYGIRHLFAPSNVRKFIDFAENGAPSKVGNLL